VVKKWLPGMEVFQPSQAVLLEIKRRERLANVSADNLLFVFTKTYYVSSEMLNKPSAGTMGHVRHFTLLLLTS
jgi:hypothetical protein